MALDPGVVYEAQDHGDLLGYFTVQNATRNSATRQWVGFGEWQGATRSSSELELRERPQTAELVKDGKPATSPIFTESVDDRDIKKKTTVYDEEGKEIPEGQVPADDNPPTLKRKQGDIDRMPQVAPPKKPAPVPTSADDDPDRPKLKRGSAASPESSGTAGAGSAGTTAAGATTPTGSTQAAKAAKVKTPDEDPNRPILRRGGAGQQKTGTSETAQGAGVPVPGRIQARGEATAATPKPGSGFATRTFDAVAVSDAEETQLRQDYRFHWTESEREEAAAKMRTLVQQEVAKFQALQGGVAAQKTSSVRTSTKTGTRQPIQGTTRVAVPMELADVQLAALDLDANNSAELVLTGRGVLENGKTLFVTLVACTDVNGNPRKLFAVVTSGDRLDVSPRLELVDAVDADGDRRGELLFRRIRESSSEFVLYRVGVDALTELFHGGNAE